MRRTLIHEQWALRFSPNENCGIDKVVVGTMLRVTHNMYTLLDACALKHRGVSAPFKPSVIHAWPYSSLRCHRQSDKDRLEMTAVNPPGTRNMISIP